VKRGAIVVEAARSVYTGKPRPVDERHLPLERIDDLA
jgi:hypothetical protein